MKRTRAQLFMCMPSETAVMHTTLLWLGSHDIIRPRAHSHWLEVISSFRGKDKGCRSPASGCLWLTQLRFSFKGGLIFFVYSLHNLTCVLTVAPYSQVIWSNNVIVVLSTGTCLCFIAEILPSDPLMSAPWLDQDVSVQSANALWYGGWKKKSYI